MILTYLFQVVRPEAPPLDPIDRWNWVFPAVESIHICCFSLFIGAIAILDLRMLGIILKRQNVAQLAQSLKPWITGGLIGALIAGFYLFESDPADYVQVTAWRVKMILLALAIIFHYTVMRRATSAAVDSESPGWRKPAAVLSLASWIAVMLGGMWIGNL